MERLTQRRYSYNAVRRLTHCQLHKDPTSFQASISDLSTPYNLSPSTVAELTSCLQTFGTEKMTELLMAFQHSVSEPVSSRAFGCAFTIIIGYFLGGSAPLLSNLSRHADIATALERSIGTMGVPWFVFGYANTCINTGWRGFRNVAAGSWGGAKMAIEGAVAAAASMGMVRWF